MRRAAKVDANQDEIVQTYRACGLSVTSLAGLGRGVPDLLVGYRGKLALVEVKQPKGKLRPMQEAFRLTWPVRIVRTVEDAYDHIRELRVA